MPPSSPPPLPRPPPPPSVPPPFPSPSPPPPPLPYLLLHHLLRRFLHHSPGRHPHHRHPHHRRHHPAAIAATATAPPTGSPPPSLCHHCSGRLAWPCHPFCAVRLAPIVRRAAASTRRALGNRLGQRRRRLLRCLDPPRPHGRLHALRRVRRPLHGHSLVLAQPHGHARARRPRCAVRPPSVAHPSVPAACCHTDRADRAFPRDVPHACRPSPRPHSHRPVPSPRRGRPVMGLLRQGYTLRRC
mmetsp:Transcript_15448/g.36766  ORF Transcript_15448/g.36766 Transcript_15448/m.36766 type:complete len:243 (+) Transcript_15448:1146-1874(+)